VHLGHDAHGVVCAGSWSCAWGCDVLGRGRSVRGVVCMGGMRWVVMHARWYGLGRVRWVVHSARGCNALGRGRGVCRVVHTGGTHWVMLCKEVGRVQCRGRIRPRTLGCLLHPASSRCKHTVPLLLPWTRGAPMAAGWHSFKSPIVLQVLLGMLHLRSGHDKQLEALCQRKLCVLHARCALHLGEPPGHCVVMVVGNARGI
jgi:hypothetical protein